MKTGPSRPDSSIVLYLSRQADGFWRYWLEQSLFALTGWVPTLVGIGLRAILYRLILKMDGMAAIENGVRLRFASRIRLGKGVYLDQGSYLHAAPNGIEIGDRSIVMHGAVLHVYNFRDLPNAGIWIGKDSLVGEYSVIRGQGGVHIGDRVYTSPFTQIIAVNHVFDDPKRPFVEQGIPARSGGTNRPFSSFGRGRRRRGILVGRLIRMKVPFLALPGELVVLGCCCTDSDKQQCGYQYPNAEDCQDNN